MENPGPRASNADRDRYASCANEMHAAGYLDDEERESLVHCVETAKHVNALKRLVSEKGLPAMPSQQLPAAAEFSEHRKLVAAWEKRNTVVKAKFASAAIVSLLAAVGVPSTVATASHGLGNAGPVALPAVIMSVIVGIVSELIIVVSFAVWLDENKKPAEPASYTCRNCNERNWC